VVIYNNMCFRGTERVEWSCKIVCVLRYKDSERSCIIVGVYGYKDSERSCIIVCVLWGQRE
jgi:hypothetical protein